MNINALCHQVSPDEKPSTRLCENPNFLALIFKLFLFYNYMSLKYNYMTICHQMSPDVTRWIQLSGDLNNYIFSLNLLVKRGVLRLFLIIIYILLYKNKCHQMSPLVFDYI